MADLDQITAAQSDEKACSLPRRRVFFYIGPGAAGEGLRTIPTILSMSKTFNIELTKGVNLPPHLEVFDAIIFPGGEAKKMMATLTPEGATILKSEVDKGLGFVGICAGAYLGSLCNECRNFKHGLALLKVSCICGAHGHTIIGDTKFHIVGKKNFSCKYHQGKLCCLTLDCVTELNHCAIRSSV